MNLTPVFRQRFFDSNGAPLASGSLSTYAAGTTTPQTTYSSAAGIANTNPVLLDGAGYADVWLDPAFVYKFVLKDASGVTQWTVDNVQVSSNTGITYWVSNQVYQQGQIVQDSSGIFYVSLTNSNQNNALTSVANWRVYDGNIRTLSTNTTLAVTDNHVRSNSTSGNLTHTLPPCSTTPIGKRITVIDVGTGGNTTTVKGSGTDLVDGNNTFADALLQYQSFTFINTGSAWDVLGKVAAKSITSAKIADATITATQISASAAITGSQLAASAGITAAQLVSSINLAGVPQANGLDIVTQSSATNGALKMIRGQMDGTSGALSVGEGCSGSTSGSTQYNVVFTSAFSATPVVTVTPIENTARVATILSASSTGFSVVIYDLALVSKVCNFSFIAIGPR